MLNELNKKSSKGDLYKGTLDETAESTE